MKTQTTETKSNREMGEALTALQRQIIAEKIPVIILFEGFTTAGKGSAINSLILNFDPRGFSVFTTRKPEEYEVRQPWLARFAQKMPTYGRIAVFDRSWYSGAAQFGSNIKKPNRWNRYFKDISTFERQLTDDGYLIIKFFLRISKKEQKKRVEALLADKHTAWRVDADARLSMDRYDDLDAFYRRMLETTDSRYAKWHVIDAKSRKAVRSCVQAAVADAITHALEKRQAGPPPDLPPQTPYINIRFRMAPAQKIGETDLTKSMPREQYDKELAALQRRLRELHNIVYTKKLPIVIAFEGNDAAGKGGAIKRLARALDPRGYTVCPVGAPTAEELHHQFLWRFWNN
ncbi:MAG TPA: phosphate--AMP phosphotransferase, partial [Clostridiales bacterium]|nr:phosphate--AMP phosphotransferase [Clostridiales bacterium]